MWGAAGKTSTTMSEEEAEIWSSAASIALSVGVVCGSQRLDLCEPHTTPTDKEIDAALDQLFASSSFIVVADLPSALHICRSVAYRIARRLEAEGKLRNVGSPRRKIFVRGEG